MDEISGVDYGILMDTALTMATYAMGKSCSAEEIEEFFTAQKERLVVQGLAEDRVDFLLANLRNGVMSINSLRVA